MKVYTLVVDYDCEGEAFRAVFSSLDRAKTCADQLGGHPVSWQDMVHHPDNTFSIFGTSGKYDAYTIYITELDPEKVSP